MKIKDKKLKRIKWFFKLVWRPAWGPGRINIKTAWDVGKILENL